MNRRQPVTYDLPTRRTSGAARIAQMLGVAVLTLAVFFGIIALVVRPSTGPASAQTPAPTASASTTSTPSPAPTPSATPTPSPLFDVAAVTRQTTATTAKLWPAWGQKDAKVRQRQLAAICMPAAVPTLTAHPRVVRPVGAPTVKATATSVVVTQRDGKQTVTVTLIPVHEGVWSVASVIVK